MVQWQRKRQDIRVYGDVREKINDAMQLLEDMCFHLIRGSNSTNVFERRQAQHSIVQEAVKLGHKAFACWKGQACG